MVMMLHQAGMLVCLPARSRQVAHGMPRAILRADHAVGDIEDQGCAVQQVEAGPVQPGTHW